VLAGDDGHGSPEGVGERERAHPLYISLFTDLPGDAWTLRVCSYAVAAIVVLTAGAGSRRTRSPVRAGPTDLAQAKPDPEEC
jgi:hypothetical protein